MIDDLTPILREIPDGKRGFTPSGLPATDPSNQQYGPWNRPWTRRETCLEPARGKG